MRGNNDTGAWARKLRGVERLEIDGVAICVVHDVHGFAGRGCRVVVSGHSHKPKIEERDGVLAMIPGSAGPWRFSLPTAPGGLLISRLSVRARIKELSS